MLVGIKAGPLYRGLAYTASLPAPSIRQSGKCWRPEQRQLHPLHPFNKMLQIAYTT